MVLGQIEKQFREDFMVLNNYSLELKSTNPSNSVFIISERHKLNKLPMFKKIYICLTLITKGFNSGCWKLIGLDRFFLKGLLKGQILVVVGRYINNQMYPIVWAVMEKETSESWS